MKPELLTLEQYKTKYKNRQPKTPKPANINNKAMQEPTTPNKSHLKTWNQPETPNTTTDIFIPINNKSLKINRSNL